MASGLAAARDLAGIDWSAPWLAPYRALGESLALQVTCGKTCSDALNSASPAVHFVSQSALPPGMAYEQFVFASQTVPTREGLHDFFNGLCWLHFPRTKQRLNELQAAQIAAEGIGAVRGATRDAITLFDENAALLQAPDALWDALEQRDWQRLFIDLRPLWAQAQMLLFGHALLEKLVTPRKAVTAHVYRVHAGGAALPEVDRWLFDNLSAQRLAAKPFAPLPVLGVPGWWPENEKPGFYADAQVFRPARVPVSDENYK